MRARGAARARSQQLGGAISSALPFLLLSSLSTIGYFEALEVMLSAAELSGDISLFATGLAFKVLDAPERGWRQSPAVTADAAVFAGLAEPAPNEALGVFARKAADFLPALDRVITDALARGHESDAPMIFCAAPTGGWLLAETRAVFPVAWHESWEGLLDTVARFRPTVVLVPAACSDTELLVRLDGSGFRFLTDGPPIPSAALRPIHRPSHDRWWTNDRSGPEGPLAAAGRELASSAEALATCWRELCATRTAVAPGNGGPLERSLALAAAVALADLSWNLWGAAGATDPLLAIERFATLDARVEFGPDEIRVKLPLGKRSLDLSANGWLGDVCSVPWFGGRMVRFSGGAPW